MKNPQRGEIATILTLGALLIIGVSSLVSSVFLSKNNKQVSSTKAQQAGESCEEEGAYQYKCTGNYSVCEAGQGEAQVFYCQDGQWSEQQSECQDQCQEVSEADRNFIDPACNGKNPGDMIDSCVRKDCDASIDKQVCIERFCDTYGHVQDKVGYVTELSCSDVDDGNSAGRDTKDEEGNSALLPTKEPFNPIVPTTRPGGSSTGTSTGARTSTQPTPTRVIASVPTATSAPDGPTSKIGDYCTFNGGKMILGATVCRGDTSYACLGITGGILDVFPTQCSNGCNSDTGSCNPPRSATPTPAGPARCNYFETTVASGSTNCNGGAVYVCLNGTMDVVNCSNGCSTITNQCNAASVSTPTPIPTVAPTSSAECIEGTITCTPDHLSQKRCIGGRYITTACVGVYKCNEGEGCTSIAPSPTPYPTATPAPTATPVPPITRCSLNGISYSCSSSGERQTLSCTGSNFFGGSYTGTKIAVAICGQTQGSICGNVGFYSPSGENIGSGACPAPAAAQGDTFVVSTKKQINVLVQNSCKLTGNYIVGVSRVEDGKDVVVDKQSLNPSIQNAKFNYTMVKGQKEVMLKPWILYQVAGETQYKLVSGAVTVLSAKKADALLGVNIACQ